MIDDNISSPEKKNKRPAWTRFLDIALQTAHVAVTSIFFGGAVFDVPFYRLDLWLYLTIATGLAFIASEVRHNRHWPYHDRGVMALIHTALFGLIRLRPDLMVPLLTAVIFFGMVGSHMSKKFRYWSSIHRKVMD